MDNKRINKFMIVVYIFLIAYMCSVPLLWADVSRLASLPINEPLQVTSEAEPVLYGSVSRDGKLLVYTAQRGEFTDLWLRSATPETETILPEQLTFDPASETSPVFSPNGRYIAYVGTGYDVKGDIYILDLKSRDKEPRRLTGRDTEDGAPCFTPDNRTIFFHQARSSSDTRVVVRMDFTSDEPSAFPVETGGDSSFPAVSPDGRKLAFVSYRNDLGGDIFVSDVDGKNLKQLTEGEALDIYPAWSNDSEIVYFSRVFIDTNLDDKVSLQDNAVLFRASVADSSLSGVPSAYPITSASYSSISPVVVGSKVFFLSDRNGITNVFVLPKDGEIPTLDTAQKQFALAKEINKKIPPDLNLTILAYFRVLEAFIKDKEFAGKATFLIGQNFQKLGFKRAAQRAYQLTAEQYGSVQPETALSRIALSVINAQIQWESSMTASEKEKTLETVFAELDDIEKQYSNVDIVHDRVLIEKALFLLNMAKDADSFTEAIDLLAKVRRGHDEISRSTKAESMVIKAQAYEQLGQADRVYPTYLEVVDRYSDVEEWADKAIEAILDMVLAQEDLTTLEERVGKLQNIARENKEKRPRLAMAALNRVGDIYYDEDEWAQAKAAYHEVLNNFLQINTQTAAARLALAEINYKEERFRKALDLYEKEMGKRKPYEDNVYRLARVGYIQKSIEAGEFLYRIGEIASARTLFKDLITYDSTIIEAHRGYIKCAAAQNQIKPVLKDYQKMLEKESENPVIIYATGLCMTYLNTEQSLNKAKSLVAKSIELKGNVEYFHQTYGYILEVSETVYGKEGQLELALESYRKAYSLNDHQKNPRNAANLLLNMGNGHYLLGQHNMAFKYYSQRLDIGIPFDNEETEILFYRRYGETAYQVDEPEKTIEAYQKALDLINARMDPKSPSEAFDRLIRYVMDQVIAPIAKEPSFKNRADEVSKDQSEIHQTLFELTGQNIFAPPDPSWEAYQQKIEQLLPKQEDINKECLSLMKSANLQGMDYETVRQTLKYMTDRIDSAITFPKRLVQLQAELLDRLGFAFQQAGQWHRAQETFETVFQKNQALGLMQNLARNLRSTAYNNYMLAGTVQGRKREELLKKASEDFHKVIELVDKYGVPERKDKKKAFIEISQEVAFDEITATEAAYGFSAVQEKRLAEALISRINVELGLLIPAQAAIETQVTEYPPDKFVSQKDQYGVSILFHRAGHIAFARKDYNGAFNYFRRSAELAYRMANPVSSAINVANMAHVLSKISSNDNSYNEYRREFRIYDKKVSELLAENVPSLNRNFLAKYHNTIGTYFFVLPEVNDSNIQTAIDIERVQAGVFHFVRGIQTIQNFSQDRESMAFLAVLHLNMAYAASVLGESPDDHLNQALAISEEALLPQFQWRVLAEMGKFEKALDVLESVTFLQFSTGPQEITLAFAPLIVQMVNDGKVEDAFNLSEKVSEIERVHRMTPLFIEESNPSQIRLFKDIYNRLVRIDQLKQQLSQAKEADVGYLTDSLEKERELLRHKTGQELEKLPEIVTLLKSQSLQEQIMLLMAAAFMAEDAAESAFKGKEPKSAYDEKLQQYHQIRQLLIQPREELVPEGIMALFGPNPVQAGDLMMELSDEVVLLRLFKVHEPQKGFIVFTLTRDNVEAEFVNSLDSVTIPSSNNVYMAYEEPDELPNIAGVTYVLSATHLDRALMNRKPFKRLLLTYPDVNINVPESFKAKSLSLDTSSEELLTQLPGNHTFVINSKIGVFTKVPTRQGRIPEQFLGLEMDRGKHLPLIQLGESLFNTGLVILTDAYPEDAYLIGNFFSIIGCPTVLFLEKPDRASVNVGQFLEVYSNESAAQAVARVSRSSKSQWRQFGFKGMTEDEANAFAREHFEHYVKEAQYASRVNNPLAALSLFENALLIAQEVQDYSQYLPELYFFCRESAYQAGQYDKALEYASALVDLYKHGHTNSEQEAQALMVLGLLQSRFEQYERAIKSLENSLKIIEALAIDDKRIEVLDSMGVVLENATEYDRALEKYMDAAKLSQSFNNEEWLAQQYINIGRIYDLRLSQYAKARLFYEKSLDAYKRLGNKSGIASAHLDIGRCYRLLGNFHDAEKHYSLALQAAQDDTSEDGLRIRSKIIIEQANNAWFQARYQDAMDLQTESYKEAKQNNWLLEQVIALNTAGLIWWTLGDNERAIRKLDDALTIAKSLESRIDEVATTLNNIGIVYREMEQYDRAIESFDRAIEIDKKLKSRWAIAYDLRNKGLTLLRMGKAKESVPLFQESAKEAGAIGNRINESKAFLALGQANKVLGNNAEAEKNLKYALELAKNMALREVQWRCMFELAELKLSQGSQESARQLLTEAIKLIETMRADIKILQMRDGFISNKLIVYETLVSLLINMGRSNEAFDIAERSRARNFIDLLGNQRLNLYGAVDQELYNRYQTLRSRIDENEMLMAQAADKTERKAYLEILNHVKDEYQELMVEIMQKNPELSSIVSVNPMKLGDVKARLEPGVTLAVYYTVPDNIFTWIITKARDELVKTVINREVLGKQVLRYRQMIQNLDPVEEQSQKLYTLLISPVLPHIQGQKTLGIIPHGLLHLLSFATLSDGENYLVDSYPLFYLPSASVMGYTTEKRRDDRNVNVLAIGNPDLDDPALALPFAEHEVETIKWNFPQIKIVTGKEATESWVLKHIEEYGIIHLASHGEFDPVNPLFSAIKLRPDAYSDGDLQARDVFSIHLNADLVVLSACQTGLGKITKGDEVIGLNRAFFYAGTHAILSTLWRVSDVSTAILIKQFYRSYTKKNKADSLRRATLHVKNRYPHPGYWGALTLVGDYY